MSSRIALLLACTLLHPPGARADHDPYEGTIPTVTPTPFGGVAPRAPTRVELRSATIEVDLDPDALRNERRMTYALSNPGEPTTVRVGFRFRWYSEHRRSGAPENPLDRASALSLEGLGGITCDEISDVRWDDVPRRHGTPSGEASAWCSFDLHAPHGDFRWKFAAGAWDLDFPLGTRVSAVVYPLEAEAAWPGHAPAHAVVAARPGWRHPLVPVSPPGARIEGRKIAWELAPARGAVVVSFDAHGEAAPDAPIVVGGAGYTAVASSTLSAQGRTRYDASQVVDGDRATAWCEGAPGVGVQEWIEVRTRLDAAGLARCRVEGFKVIPGYARSDASWARNGRLRRIRLTSCADASDGFEADVGGEGEAFLVPNPTVKLLRGAPFKTERGCFRLTILAVEPGQDPDTCVSEFIPVLGCAP